MLIIKYKLGSKGIRPFYAYTGAAGIDLSLPEELTIYPREICTVSLQIGFEMPSDVYISLHGRSSMLSKQALFVDSAIIDNDYKGFVHAVIFNPFDKHVVLSRGARVIQAVVHPYQPVEYVQVEEFGQTLRNAKGIGSTGLYKYKGGQNEDN